MDANGWNQILVGTAENDCRRWFGIWMLGVAGLPSLDPETKELKELRP